MYNLTQDIKIKYKNPVFILGDLNAQNHAWGSGITNRSGDNLLEYLDNSGYVFINDGHRPE